MMKRKPMNKSVKVILILLIGIVATFYYMKAVEKKTSKDDDGIVKMASNITAGMTRNDVEMTLAGNGFKTNEKTPSAKDPKHRKVFFKISSKSTFAWVRYDVLVEYDEKDQLKTARFLKSNHSDGRDTSCVILREIPARNITYPAQCPPDIQDF
jgi:hypothetical protein